VTRATNWIFLGDSITEGVGSLRATYVSELVNRLRAAPAARTVHDLRLREVEPDFNRFIRVNLAGFLRNDQRGAAPALWVWNLASEASTIESDRKWLPLIENLRPERVFIHRGSLESVLRPARFHDGRWPWWVPRSWRGLVAMDPRCYFSDTPLRKLKQSFIDSAKQRARHRFLRDGSPQPLLNDADILWHYDALLQTLRALGSDVTMLGLLAPDERTFPGSAAHFLAMNARLRSLAARHGAEFVDWQEEFDASGGGRFYRDGLHPNAEGSMRLAEILHARLMGRGDW
jgi:hypothetical protein